MCVWVFVKYINKFVCVCVVHAWVWRGALQARNFTIFSALKHSQLYSSIAAGKKNNAFTNGAKCDRFVLIMKTLLVIRMFFR